MTDPESTDPEPQIAEASRLLKRWVRVTEFVAALCWLICLALIIWSFTH